MISTKGRYGLRVMIDLAQHSNDGFIPLKDISERQEISKKYLEIIVKKLVDCRMVRSLSGKGGGYCLSRKPEEYSVGEILEKMEDTLVPVACLKEGAEVCPRNEFCDTLPMWKEFNQVVHDFFYSKTLAEISHTEDSLK